MKIFILNKIYFRRARSFPRGKLVSEFLSFSSHQQFTHYTEFIISDTFKGCTCNLVQINFNMCACFRISYLLYIIKIIAYCYVIIEEFKFIYYTFTYTHILSFKDI